MDIGQLFGAGAGEVTAQTLEAIKKTLGGEPSKYIPGYGIVEKNITTATGLNAYNLEPAAKLLVPAITPLRNMIPRVGNTRGGTAVNYKVITSIDINRADVFTAEGQKAATISYTVTPMSNAFATISKGDNFTFQSQWAGMTFEDVRARGIARLLRHVLIHEEQAILGGRISSLGAVTAPTVTLLSTGGTIAAGASGYQVVAKAITNLGTGRARASAATTTAAAVGSTNKLTANTPYVEGAIAYEWYVDNGAAGTSTLQATTQINSVALTALTTTGTVLNTVNTSADPLAYDGILAQLTASSSNVVTLATGADGAGTGMALTDLDGLFRSAWDTYRSNPDVIIVNSEQSLRITNLVLAATGGPTMFVQNNAAEKAELVGGYRVSHYVNKATGKNVPIVTHPYMKSGTLLGLTFDMPFPASDIINPIEIETRQEYLQLDYPIVAPKWEYEVMVDAVVKMFFPGSCFVLRNIAPGT